MQFHKHSSSVAVILWMVIYDAVYGYIGFMRIVQDKNDQSFVNIAHNERGAPGWLSKNVWDASYGSSVIHFGMSFTTSAYCVVPRSSEIDVIVALKLQVGVVSKTKLIAEVANCRLNKSNIVSNHGNVAIIANKPVNLSRACGLNVTLMTTSHSQWGDYTFFCEIRARTENSTFIPYIKSNALRLLILPTPLRKHQLFSKNEWLYSFPIFQNKPDVSPYVGGVLNNLFSSNHGHECWTIATFGVHGVYHKTISWTANNSFIDLLNNEFYVSDIKSLLRAENRTNASHVAMAVTLKNRRCGVHFCAPDDLINVDLGTFDLVTSVGRPYICKVYTKPFYYISLSTLHTSQFCITIFCKKYTLRTYKAANPVLMKLINISNPLGKVCITAAKLTDLSATYFSELSKADGGKHTLEVNPENAQKFRRDFTLKFFFPVKIRPRPRTSCLIGKPCSITGVFLGLPLPKINYLAINSRRYFPNKGTQYASDIGLNFEFAASRNHFACHISPYDSRTEQAIVISAVASNKDASNDEITKGRFNTYIQTILWPTFSSIPAVCKKPCLARGNLTFECVTNNSDWYYSNNYQMKTNWRLGTQLVDDLHASIPQTFFLQEERGRLTIYTQSNNNTRMLLKAYSTLTCEVTIIDNYDNTTAFNSTQHDEMKYLIVELAEPIIELKLSTSDSKGLILSIMAAAIMMVAFAIWSYFFCTKPRWTVYNIESLERAQNIDRDAERAAEAWQEMPDAPQPSTADYTFIERNSARNSNADVDIYAKDIAEGEFMENASFTGQYTPTS